MKSFWPVIIRTAVAAMLISMAACSTPQPRDHKAHHPEGAAKPSSKMGHMHGEKSAGMMNGDSMEMCQMHEKMMNTKTAEERKTLMAEHMKSMPPEKRKKHMDMMQEQMKMMHEHSGAHTHGK